MPFSYENKCLALTIDASTDIVACAQSMHTWRRKTVQACVKTSCVDSGQTMKCDPCEYLL